MYGFLYLGLGVLWCYFCDILYLFLYCDICVEYLCEVCKGEYLLDFLKEYEVLFFRGWELIIKCFKYFLKICEWYCI